ncbi:MAG TPA: ChbG/HpnK family deacetylase [Syntrophobacteraceae bacterium]|nr:ChbG/HpnK family deacetylase [Syntrophobacteraceae bacterium]
MLIINADDLGVNEQSTDRIIASYDRRLITSATAMVFMVDTARAAGLVSSGDIGVGLHLNFTTPFTCPPGDTDLQDHHQKLIRIFGRYEYSRYLYHPGIQGSISYCFQSQYKEFLRVFGKLPTHIDGHHFVHLSINLLLGGILPSGIKIRKILDCDYHTSPFDSMFRNLVSKYLKSKFTTTDLFYSLGPLIDARVAGKISKAICNNVELMVHPGDEAEFLYMHTDNYLEMINTASKGSYNDLNGTGNNLNR